MKNLFFCAIFILFLIPGFYVSNIGNLYAGPDDEIQEDVVLEDNESGDFVVEDSVDDSSSFLNEEDSNQEDGDINVIDESENDQKENEETNE